VSGQAGQYRRRIAWHVLLLAIAARVSIATGAPLPAQDAGAALKARYSALRERLAHSAFSQPLYVESTDGPTASRGDVYAVVDYPITAVSDALTSPAHWCDVLILHINVKYCHPAVRDGRTLLSVAIGRKLEQPLISAFRVEFDYGVAASRPGYLDVELNALHGPLGTGDYRIRLEAVGVETEGSFLHLQYSYSHDTAARAAMQVYLATAGRGKVGFTVVEDPGNASPRFVSGVRGANERNAMRYYLAIDAYLATLGSPGPERLDRSLERWFAATERYARQLHEIDHDAYIEMKHGEYLRQQAIQ
jgi:hypothetical protein